MAGSQGDVPGGGVLGLEPPDSLDRAGEAPRSALSEEVLPREERPVQLALGEDPFPHDAASTPARALLRLSARNARTRPAGRGSLWPRGILRPPRGRSGIGRPPREVQDLRQVRPCHPRVPGPVRLLCQTRVLARLAFRFVEPPTAGEDLRPNPVQPDLRLHVVDRRDSVGLVRQLHRLVVATQLDIICARIATRLDERAFSPICDKRLVRGTDRRLRSPVVAGHHLHDRARKARCGCQFQRHTELPEDRGSSPDIRIAPRRCRRSSPDRRRGRSRCNAATGDDLVGCRERALSPFDVIRDGMRSLP